MSPGCSEGKSLDFFLYEFVACTDEDYEEDYDEEVPYFADTAHIDVEAWKIIESFSEVF